MLLAAGVSYLHWGLGYSLAPLIAVYFATEAEKKGFASIFLFFWPPHMPAFGLAVWSVRQRAIAGGDAGSFP